MAAVRFRSDYYSELGVAWRIDIWDSAHAGAVTAFEARRPGAEIRYMAETRERHSPVCASECSFTFDIANSTHAAIITDMAGAAENRFWVAVYKNTVLQWAGVILPDTVRYQDLEYPYPFEVRAADGIAALKDTQYTDAGTRYTGPATMLTHVLNVLNKLPYVASLWGGSDEFLRTSIDFWDGNGPATPAGTDDPWKIYWVLHEALYKFEKGEARVQSCYSVLSNILTAWGARIYLVDGVFWCEQIHVRNASAFYARNYSKTGTQLSVDNATGDNQVNQSDNDKINGLQYEFYPALNRVEVTFNAFNRRNYLAGYTVTDPSPSQDIEIKDNSGSAALHISFGISLFITNDAYTVSPVNFAALIFKITVKVGSKRVERTVTVSNYTVNYAPNATWETDTGTQYVHFAYPVNLPVVGQSSIYTIPFDFITPTLESSGTWLFDIFFDGALDQNGGVIDVADFTSDLEITNPYMEVFSYGQPQQNEDDILYKANNPTSGNTAILEVETYIGDADNPNTVGRLQYGVSAGSLVDTTSWGAGTDTRNKNLGDLLATTILHGQLTPIRKMIGSVRGNFLAWRRWFQDLDNTYWLMLGGTWQTGNDILDGEWFRLQYGSGGVSVTPVRRRVNIFPTTSLPTTPSTNQGPGVTTQATGNVEGLVIRPLANNTSHDAITSGAISVINVNTVLESDEYQTGELVTIYNPINGIFETVTVTADTTNGSTTISVSGSLINSYPVGAYIIKKPVVGITTLPGGDLGDILRHDGTEWADYNGANDGYPLVYDTTNGWQEEQLNTAGLANNAVTLAKMADIDTQRVLGRNTAGTGDPESLTLAEVLDWLTTTQGSILYRNATAWVALTPGTNGHVLTTGGAGANPSWASASGYSDEQAQDAVGGILTDSSTIDFIYADATPSITASIIDASVTLAKMANLVTQRLIGRNTAGTGVPESVTLAQVLDWITTTQGSIIYRNATTWVALTPGTNGQFLRTNGSGANPSWSSAVGGTGTANRIAIWSDTNTITADDAPLYWDFTNNRLGVNTSTPNSAVLHIVNADTFVYALRMDGSISGGNQGLLLANTANAADSNSLLNISVGGTSAGDPVLQWSIGSGTQWSMGSDNSDSDKMKIKAQITPSVGSNQGLTITNGAPSLFGINNDAPSVALDCTLNTSAVGLPIGTTAQRPALNGALRGNSTILGLEYRYGGFWHRLTSQATPTYTVGAAAGTSATGSVTGNDLAGQITFTTGATGLSTGTVFTVTFAQQHDPSIFTWIVFSARNAAAALEIQKLYLGGSGNTAFTIAAAANLTASTTYTLSYMVKQ